MSEAYLNFAVNFFAQLLVFLIHAYYEKKLAKVPNILWLGLFTGIVFGPIFDLLGKYLGLGWYALGFGTLSLTLNAVLMYSLFADNALLMQKARFLHFYFWTMVYVVVCEVTNLFFPMWTYTLAVPSTAYWVVAFGSPLGLAMVFALTWHVLFRRRFVVVTDMFKK
jgi:hypothetical protein